MSDPSEPLKADGVVAPDGVTAPNGAVAPEGAEAESESGAIESPAKIIRIGAMIKQLLEEVRGTSMDEAARGQLRSIYDSSISELRGALSPELSEELERLTLGFEDASIPSEAELMVAKAQLVGWLEGLFHGIQATLVAQQMAAQQQLEGVRGQLAEGQQAPAGAARLPLTSGRFQPRDTGRSDPVVRLLHCSEGGGRRHSTDQGPRGRFLRTSASAHRVLDARRCLPDR